jgi:hypothetical protein
MRFIGYLATVVLTAGCAGGGLQQSAIPLLGVSGTNPMSRAPSGAVAAAASSVAKPVPVPCFFNNQLVSIFIIPLSPNAAAQELLHNKNLNTIFEAVGFTPVIDEIQGPGFNPLWQVVNITFNRGVAPHQFTSAADILAAPSSEITLTFTNMVDTVPVVGSTGK